jgi:hypothetical protein
MNSSEHIRRLAGGIRFRPDKETDERILASAEAALRKKTFPDIEPEKIRSMIMRNPTIRIAVAAAVVVACVIGLSLWRTTGSGIALADVLARIEQVEGLRCKIYYKRTNYNPALDKPYDIEMRVTQLVSQEHGVKKIIERPDPNGAWSKSETLYLLPQKRTGIQILHAQKIYGRAEVDDTIVRSMREQYSSDPQVFLKQITEHKYQYKSLGIETIDGNKVEVFQTTDPNYMPRGFRNPQVDVKIWVDVKTRLPVRYESLQSGDFDQMGHRVRQQLVESDFQWDVPLDAAEFDPPPVPEGYKSLVVKYPAHITDQTVIQALNLLVELLGKYPEAINYPADFEVDPANMYGLERTLLGLVEKSENPAAMRLKEEIKGLTEEEINNKLVDLLVPIRGLARFANVLQRDKKDPAYYGKTVTPKDADKVLLRWKVSDSEYRVIYGDLHAETVTPEKLAELEAALPK